MALKTFYVGCKGVVVSRNKALVLQKSDQEGKKFFDIPGGRIDDKETISETLSRELHEEIPNLGPFKITHLLNAYRLSHDLKDGNGLILLFYKVDADLETVEISNEHSSFQWISKDNLEVLRSTQDIYIESGYFEAVKLALEQ